MKHQWLYQNDSGRRVRLRVGGTHVGDVGPGGRRWFPPARTSGCPSASSAKQ